MSSNLLIKKFPRINVTVQCLQTETGLGGLAYIQTILKLNLTCSAIWDSSNFVKSEIAGRRKGKTLLFARSHLPASCLFIKPNPVCVGRSGLLRLEAILPADAHATSTAAAPRVDVIESRRRTVCVCRLNPTKAWID